MQLRFFLLLLCSLVYSQSMAQVSFCAKVNGNYCYRLNSPFNIETGIGGELGVQWMTRRTFVGLNYQRIHWLSSQIYVTDIRSNLFEMTFGFHKRIKEHHVLELRMAFGHMSNKVGFNQEKEPGANKYNDEFEWKNLALGLMFVFHHETGILGSIGYRGFIGNATMPANNPRYIAIGLGYQLGLSKILNK